MKDILSPVPLENIGYNPRYTLFPCGKVYDSSAKKFCSIYSGTKYSLKDSSGKYVSVSLRKLYRLAYNKLYIRDNIDDLENERWIDISAIERYRNLEGLYKISSLGRVKSYERYDATLLKPYDNGRGYYMVFIQGKNIRLNRLVLMAFNPTDNETLQADHKNFDTHDNRLENLQWLTCQDNIARSWNRRY